MDLDIKRMKKKKKARVTCDQPRIRWGGLTTARPLMIGVKLAAMVSCGSTDCIRIATREVLGVSRPGGHKEDWWWNGKVQGKVEIKKVLRLNINGKNNKENKRRNRRELECKKSNRKLYKLAKAREKREQVLDQVKSIKNENDKVLVKEMHIRLRWKTISP
ncbi:hypothetical protein H5410_061920 [Solanum commersonii]|uniref:Uncharacterized protein n=1 Tax=Solanum commersonii TaxID=4109 RepID=A0A9J5W9C8_SOLCO|nr:hypothetical protein H5410_061920 [Solanum commersonii]